MKDRLIPYLLPRLRDLFFIVLLLAVLVLGPRMLNMDGDLPRHLLMGQLILDTSSVPDTEPFVYPYLGQTYVTHEWLSTVIFAILYKFAGLTGIVIISALLIAGTFLVIFASTSKQYGNLFLILFITAWGAAATSLNWVTRPHLFSMFFLAIWLVLAGRLERGERIPIWWFPVLMVVWSNFHGEFIAGILVLVAFAVGWGITYLFCPETTNMEVGKRTWLALVLSFLASLVNPAGIGSWKTMFGFMNNAYLMSRMTEANSPNFQNADLFILLGLIMFSIFILSIKKNSITVGKALLLAGFTAMSLQAARNVHLYGVVVPFVLAKPISEFSNLRFFNRIESIIRRGEQQLKGLLWPFISAVLVIGFLIVSGIGEQIYQFSPDFFPVDALKWVQEHPPVGNMLNDLNWGGYISFKRWPDDLVFIDSMTDVTGDITYQYETAITLAPGWDEVLEEYQVQWVILPPSYPLSTWLEQSQEWELLYRDDIALVWQYR